MRIGIDARFLGPGQTGIGRYLERLIAHLAVIDAENHYVVFLRAAAFRDWSPPGGRWSKALADIPWYTAAEQMRLTGIFDGARLDLLHVPHFNVPILLRGPFVVTIHDLILDRFPPRRGGALEPWTSLLKSWGYRIGIRSAARRSRAILSVSQYSKRQIVERFGVPEDKVAVTYEAADPLPSPAPLEAIVAKGVRSPYLLHVGGAHPHKNLERLIDAAIRARRDGESFQLVITGGRDDFSRRLEAHARARAGSDHVLFYGYAPDAELHALYRGARALFFPSLSEGFGLPGLEAMQVGTPVYAARASCLPEIYGAAAAWFDPLRVDDITESMRRALHDDAERARLIEAGRARHGEYSWTATAEGTLEVYRRALASSR